MTVFAIKISKKNKFYKSVLLFFTLTLFFSPLKASEAFSNIETKIKVFIMQLNPKSSREQINENLKKLQGFLEQNLEQADKGSIKLTEKEKYLLTALSEYLKIFQPFEKTQCSSYLREILLGYNGTEINEQTPPSAKIAFQVYKKLCRL
ncbi:MAG: hypothetical protein D6797_04500 [Bdellovibrio sp.]|nr:MAG: hypothetical protein D6797_04500 [Bdellovibrio sp.]